MNTVSPTQARRDANNRRFVEAVARIALAGYGAARNMRPWTLAPGARAWSFDDRLARMSHRARNAVLLRQAATLRAGEHEAIQALRALVPEPKERARALAVARMLSREVRPARRFDPAVETRIRQALSLTEPGQRGP